MLSQFSKTKTAAGTDIGDGEFEDDMNDLLDDADVEDSEEQKEDDLDFDRESSDQLKIEQLAREVEKIHRLSKAQIMHGRFSVTKVRHLFVFLSLTYFYFAIDYATHETYFPLAGPLRGLECIMYQAQDSIKAGRTFCPHPMEFRCRNGKACA
jgi:hypothetical protein